MLNLLPLQHVAASSLKALENELQPQQTNEKQPTFHRNAKFNQREFCTKEFSSVEAFSAFSCINHPRVCFVFCLTRSALKQIVKEKRLEIFSNFSPNVAVRDDDRDVSRM